MKRLLTISALLLAAGLIFAESLTLDLEGFVARVEGNSLDLEKARIDRDIAGTQERLAKSAIYPFIGGEVGYVRNLKEITQTTEIPGMGSFETKLNTKNEFSLGLSVQQALFDMKAFRGVEASMGFLRLTDTAYEATRQGILTFAKKLFYQTLLLQAVYDVRESSQENAYENYQETQAKFENGIASRIDLLRAEVNWKVTIPETTKARKDLDVALSNLKNIAGIEADQDLALNGSLLDYPEPPVQLELGEALGSRPDYQVLREQQKLQEINLAAKRAEFYPSLSANFTYGRQVSSDEFDLSDPTEMMSIGLTVSVPIFYGGSRFAGLNQAKLELEQVENDIAKKSDDVRTELETIRLTLQEASARIESAEQTFSTAELAYEITETSVENGLATQLELKDARVSLEGAQLQYYVAIFDYLNAYFDWQAATGEGASLL